MSVCEGFCRFVFHNQNPIRVGESKDTTSTETADSSHILSEKVMLPSCSFNKNLLGLIQEFTLVTLSICLSITLRSFNQAFFPQYMILMCCKVNCCCLSIQSRACLIEEFAINTGKFLTNKSKVQTLQKLIKTSFF